MENEGNPDPPIIEPPGGNALLVNPNPLFVPDADQQGEGEGGQGAAAEPQQVHQAWGGAPPKDAFSQVTHARK